MKSIKLNDIVSIPGTAQEDEFADLYEDPKAAAENITGKVTIIFEGTKKVESSTDPDAILFIEGDLAKKVKLSDAIKS